MFFYGLFAKRVPISSKMVHFWASQGENFDRRSSAWKKFRDGTSSLSEVRDVLLEREARSFEELYSVQDEFHQHMSNGTSELQ